MAYPPSTFQRVEFDITVHPDEWKAGETVMWTVSDCPETGCDIFVYKYPDGKIVARCSDCHSERGQRIE